MDTLQSIWEYRIFLTDLRLGMTKIQQLLWSKVKSASSHRLLVFSRQKLLQWNIELLDLKRPEQEYRTITQWKLRNLDVSTSSSPIEFHVSLSFQLPTIAIQKR